MMTGIFPLTATQSAPDVVRVQEATGDFEPFAADAVPPLAADLPALPVPLAAAPPMVPVLPLPNVKVEGGLAAEDAEAGAAEVAKTVSNIAKNAVPQAAPDGLLLEIPPMRSQAEVPEIRNPEGVDVVRDRTEKAAVPSSSADQMDAVASAPADAGEGQAVASAPDDPVQRERPPAPRDLRVEAQAVAQSEGLRAERVPTALPAAVLALNIPRGADGRASAQVRDGDDGRVLPSDPPDAPPDPMARALFDAPEVPVPRAPLGAWHLPMPDQPIALAAAMTEPLSRFAPVPDSPAPAPQPMPLTTPVPVENLPALLVARADVAGAAEIHLDPAELGRLVLDIVPEGDTLQVTLSAERGETADLLRRHATELVAELRQAGFAQVTLGFSSWAEGRGRAVPPPPISAPMPAPMQVAPPAATQAAALFFPALRPAWARGLNLRL